jgi:hypothetical protein
MAVYKVPQDVEADDKLIGPFSFRQFIYLIIAIIAIALGWGLAQIFIGLAIIPLPIVILFGALALPLRKDQPMEIYLAAVVSFYLKPRRRLWQPDGIQSLVEITAPKVIEVQRAKDLSQTEAEQRLSYLANIVDTGGWAVRGVAGMPAPATPMQSDVYLAAQQTEDVLDTSSGVAQSFNTMISQSDAKRRQEMIERMRRPTAQPQSQAPPIVAAPQPTIPVVDTYGPLTSPAAQPQAPDPHLTYNPYPEMHQSVISPLNTAQPAPPAAEPQQQAPQISPPNPPKPPSESVVSPDIINLANNSDLSIETIAHEANRIHQKETLPEDEVVISLR